MDNRPIVNIVESPQDSRDYKACVLYTNTKYPKKYSIRDKLNPVRNQGFQGTCAAHTAACMKEYQELIDNKFKGYMSPQFIYNLRKNKDSEGMYSRDVMKILHKKGICEEIEYPYETENEISDELIKSAQKNKIQGYAKIETIDELKRAIFINGPCLISVPTYNYSSRMWHPEHKNQKRIGGHAMTVVGWDKIGFEIRNTWSFQWADKGYTIFPYDDWGKQWEVWTTIDEKTGNPPLKKKKRRSCCI